MLLTKRIARREITRINKAIDLIIDIQADGVAYDALVRILEQLNYVRTQIELDTER
jgi:hypothetical protein